MKILLTGASGQVGAELARTLAPLGELIAVDRARMDLANRDAVAATVRAVRPDLIVNPAAYTAVDAAESDVATATAVNAIAPGILAEEAKRSGAALVHFSTDYVFDGEKPGPYVETDAPHPINVYGRTKLAGEKAIAAAGGRHLVFRTSWVYAARGRNFLTTIQRLARERPELRVVDDQRGAPTSARAIADGVAQVLAKKDWQVGLYHLSCAGETSWYGFAKAIVGDTRLVPITSADYPTPARRPKNSVLSNEKLEATFGVRLPDWQSALEATAPRGEP